MKAGLPTISNASSNGIVRSVRRKAVLLLLAITLFNSCGGCGEDTLSEANSPDNSYVATLFRRGCGATSGFLYHVNIRSAARSFSSDQRGVIEGGQVFLTREGMIKITWKDEKTLFVDCEDCSTDHKPVMQNTWNGINILYQIH